MALSLDDEIHIHLNQGHPPSFVSEWIYEKMIAADYEWSEANFNTFCLFLTKAGRTDLILYFFLKFKSDENLKIPPAYMLIAIKKSFPVISNELRKSVVAYLNEDPNNWIAASLTKVADSHWPEIKESRKKIKELNKQRLDKIRRELVHKFELFSSQNLVEPAKVAIRKLEKVFPRDPEVAKITLKFKEKHAEDVFDKHKFKRSRLDLKSKPDPEVNNAREGLALYIKQEIASFSGFEADLVIMCITMELNQLALELFHNTALIEKYIWLYLEVLLLNGRNLEVLNLLPVIEKNYSHLPDTFLACTFLRSLALWNLGERNTAIEVLQSVVDIKPNYRSSDILLAEWSRS